MPITGKADGDFEVRDFLTGGSVPKGDDVVAMSSGQNLAVGREGEAIKYTAAVAASESQEPAAN